MVQLTSSNNQQSSFVATWADAATVFTAWKLNVTNTASNSASLVMQLQVGGTNIFRVTRSGEVYSSAGINSGERGSLWGRVLIEPDNTTIAGNIPLKFSVSSVLGSPSGNDPFIYRDANHTLAQRNSTNSQTFRVYRTFTDASNYELIELAHATYSGAQYSLLRTGTAGTGADNINLVLSPSGTGAIMAQLPDGTTTGGNARGAGAVDLQRSRTAATQVASGDESFCAGKNNTASAAKSIAFGDSSAAVVQGQFAVAAGNFAAAGDAQHSVMVLRCVSTDSSKTQMYLDGASLQATIPANTAWNARLDIIGREDLGANHGSFHRQFAIKRDGTLASTALLGAVHSLDHDYTSDNTWAVTITADTGTGAVKIEVQGGTDQTVRWVARLAVVEVTHA